MKKIIMVGMNPRTRHLIPWDSDAEIWTLNEGPSKDWMKRYDILFQIHARWDWDRSNNLADPNHPRFIKDMVGDCLYCKGSGKALKDGEEVACPWCRDGLYEVPSHRDNKTIIMQDMNEDVPGCIRFPIEEVETIYGKPYLTSTLAHMLVFAIVLNGVEAEIELYGFEAESNTEYIVQRACIEYWVGYGRGLGMKIEAPGSHLLTGRHYGYEDHDQGFRSRLELRKHELQKQLNDAEVESIKSEGRLEVATQMKPEGGSMVTLWEAAYDDHFKKKNFVSFLRGTLKELTHTVEILDAYRQDSEDATQGDIRSLIQIPYSLG